MRRFLCAAAACAIVLSASVRPLHAQPDGLAIARAFREAQGARVLADFARLLAIPNVAADSGAITRNAAFIADRLRDRGVTVEVLTLPGAAPLVYGELRIPGATRTLGLYAHFDGQPVDSARWTHGPWAPTLYTAAMEAGGRVRPLPEPGEPIDPEWRLYARSAGDDKAPIAALLAVLEALEAAGADPTSNLVFFLDGEEEAGSPHLGAYLDLRRDRLRTVDAWLFLDGPVHQSGRPQIAFGARGVTGMQVTVYGPARSLHSGHYGGWAPVPGQMLAQLLASMKDSTGAVLVEGFYDSVEPVGAAERTALARLPDWDAELMRELGLVRTEGAPASLEQRLLLPSLTVRGLASGNVGALTRNVIPATATAALGIRLVKGNDPDRMLDLLEEHIRGQGYHIVRDDPDHATRLRHSRIAKVEREHGYRAVRTPMDGPIVAAVVGAARHAAEGDLVLLPTLGGSLPLYLFTDRFGAAVLVVPVANHDDNQHAPDENLRIGNLWYAVDLYGAVLTMP
jgi:acetylornithine deacetylase/succinyl-diaminopimelate desuccinylase-like protein